VGIDKIGTPLGARSCDIDLELLGGGPGGGGGSAILPAVGVSVALVGVCAPIAPVEADLREEGADRIGSAAGMYIDARFE
jgi:predicted phage tail protein